MKRCRKCGVEQDESQFYRHYGKLGAQCKRCVAVANKALVLRNKEANKSKQPGDYSVGETRRCSKCGVEKDVAEFTLNRSRKDGRAGICKTCNSEKALAWKRVNPKRHRANRDAWYDKNRDELAARREEWRLRNPDRTNANYRAWSARNTDKTKGYHLHSTYGITYEEFQRMRAEQNNECPICGCIFGEVGTKDGPCVDHDHKDDCVRGLLCRTCNCGLGLLGDSPDQLQAAIDYLTRTKEKRNAKSSA